MHFANLKMYTWLCIHKFIFTFVLM